MSDPFESDLSRLAPDIDLDRAHHAFESTRSRRRNRRRTAGGLGGAALAAALVAGVLATGGDGTESVTADGPIGFGPSLTGTASDLSEEPVTSTASDLADTADVPPAVETRDVDLVRTADNAILGRVVAQHPMDDRRVLVELRPDANWEYIDAAGVDRDSPVPDQALIEVWSVGDISVSRCDDNLAGARIEVTPLGPASSIDEQLRGSASVTVSCVDLDGARRLWREANVQAYYQEYVGWIDGESTQVVVQSAYGSVSHGPLARIERPDVVGLFDFIEASKAGGLAVTVVYNPELGYPERVQVASGNDGGIDLVSAYFWSVDALEMPCETAAGSALDLRAEPTTWTVGVPWAVGDEGLTRWYDATGCPIRLDVIGQSWGPEHCSMERARFLEIADIAPLPGVQGRRAYVFDPDRSLAGISPEEWGYRADTAERPAALVDTGLRSADRYEMWFQPDDPDHLWIIRDDELQVWRLDRAATFVCG